MSVDHTPSEDHDTSIQSNTDKFFALRKKAVVLGVLTFAIFACLIGLLGYQRFVINRELIEKETKNLVLNTREKLEKLLAQGISAAKTLSFVVLKDGTVADFDSIAAQILASNNGIDVLQLVPNGVIRYVYPLRGNEVVIGYNILKDPARNQDAFKAIQEKEVFYAGPLALKQGGMGIIGRLPVYRNNKFWGFSAVIIRLTSLLKYAGIDSQNTSGYYFQLSAINPVTHQEDFLITHAQKYAPENAISVNIYNARWKLSAMPVNPNKGYINIFWLLLLGLLFSVLAAFFTYVVVKKPEKLDRLVKMRTQALQESEHKYRSFIEQASDGIIVYSSNGAIRQFNKEAYLELGYTREEFAKLSLRDLLEDMKTVLPQTTGDAEPIGKTAIVQNKLYKKDGSLVEVEINVSMLPDDNFLAFVRNITDRKNAERALKESEQKFSKVFQSGLLGLAIYDDQNRLVDVNDCFATMLNARRDDLPGKNIGEIGLFNTADNNYSIDVRESVTKILKEKGRIKNYEVDIEKQDGKPVFLLISIEPLDLNKQHNWLITAIDITEKKNAELSLLKSEIKYRSLIEQASDGIMITDLDGIIKEVNRSICVMGGYTIEEMTGRHVYNFMPKADITEKPLRIDELMQGKTLRYERRMLKKDGSVIDVEINSKMAIGNTLIGFIRDITERKKADFELKKSNERFELIAKASNDAIWDHDFVSNETLGNENLYNIYGIAPLKNTINLQLFETHLHPEERERVLAHFEHAFAEKAVSVTDEFRFKTADGTYRHFYNRAYIKYKPEGGPARILGVMQDITGRIKDAQKLRKEKELSDSIINGLPAVFYLYNKNGKLLRWNHNFETVTGYTSEEISQLLPPDLFDKEDKPLLKQKINNVFVSGKDNVEASLLTKDKRKIPYYFSGMRVDYEGETCLMGFGLDFSDKVESDKRIKESEQKFRSLVEQASDAVAILSTEGVPLYVSPSIERILGYTESEMLKMNLFDLTHPDDRAATENLLAQVLQKPGVPVKGHISRILHKDGSWRYLEDIITNMLHVPSINGIVENLRDITEKLQIEKKIITEKELSDSIINSLPGIFYLYDNTGRFLRWNKNFETVTGYSAEEIRHMHPLDFYDEDQKKIVAQRINDLFRKKMSDVELFLLTKHGRKIPYFYNSIATEYEGVPSIVGMAFDVTERKKIEQELLISNQHLEQKAMELKTSYAELERFAYIVSHDLQEPLRMISGFLQLLQKRYKQQLDETADKYIFFAVDGAERMKQLIMDLLEYSRTGTSKDIAGNTDMNEVISNVLEVFENSIREQGAVIEIVHPLPVLPQTSKTQMFQVMQNLLSNALKFHAGNKPLVKIDAQEMGDRWVFSIQDNGIGIEQKFTDKIFIIFQRLHNKEEFPGTGIGLSICKKIIEKHGGKIWVESVPGHGSTFYFSIPKNPRAAGYEN